jgi:hypothetical protein
MMDVINLTGELHHLIESRKQITACMALQWNETKDETALEKRFGRRHEARRQVWWLSPDDRKWLRFPDRYQVDTPLGTIASMRSRVGRDTQNFMGLCVTVGILADLLENDPEGAELVRALRLNQLSQIQIAWSVRCPSGGVTSRSQWSGRLLLFVSGVPNAFRAA